MKPLSELVKELARDLGFHGTHECEQCETGKKFTDELQAWLREAGAWVDEHRYQSVTFAGQIDADAVLVDLLGTTQRPKQEGE